MNNESNTWEYMIAFEEIVDEVINREDAEGFEDFRRAVIERLKEIE